MIVTTRPRRIMGWPAPAWNSPATNKKPLPQEGPFCMHWLLFGLVQHDTTAGLLGCFFCLLLARGHCLVAPIVGCLYVVGTALCVLTSHVIGFAAVEQVHVSHGVIVILALINGGL